VAADPDVIDQHPAIAEWSGQLRKLADATGLSLRQLAAHVPWSHSTLARYLNGERVVEEAWQLVPALIQLTEQRGVDTDSRELREAFVRARKAYQEQQRAQRNRKNGLPEEESERTEEKDSAEEPTVTPDAGESSAKRWKTLRSRLILVGIAGLALLGALGGFFAVRWHAPPREIKVWQARIVGTWSDQYQQNLGVFRYRSPDVSGDTDKATYHEQTPVAIVCQARHRRLVADPSTGKSSAVWDNLSDGYWIPDLYTDLPKVDGGAPPLGIPLCP
jgi:transcriptional regulator with XRE-family HTH domain